LRLDLFLKLVGAAKTRSQATRLLQTGRVTLGVSPIKSSHEVSVGEKYIVQRLAGKDEYEVLAIPPGVSLSKKDRSLYVRVEKTHEEF
jgi:ribosomal 50S subunit-recycling heat shock protein